jgi:hypothetical protein
LSVATPSNDCPNAAGRSIIATASIITELAMSAAHRLLAALLVVLGLVACGSSSDSPKEPPPVKDTAFGDMVGTMDKARAVEDTTMQHKEELDRALNAAENAAENDR